jgi:hypothetical protein
MLFEHSFFDNFWDIFFDKNNKGRERERERVVSLRINQGGGGELCNTQTY